MTMTCVQNNGHLPVERGAFAVRSNAATVPITK